MKAEMLSFAPLSLCALALNSYRIEGSKKQAFWINEPILDFSRIDCKLFIITDLQTKHEHAPKSPKINEPIFWTWIFGHDGHPE
jgi:hypothetical protein